MTQQGQDAISIDDKIDQEENKRYRSLTGPIGWIARVLGISLPLYSLVYIADVFSHFDLYLYSVANNTIFLTAMLTLVFLWMPPSRSAAKDRVPWYDLLLIVLGGVSCLYVGVNYETIFKSGGVDISSTQIVLGVIAIIVVMEAVRRTLGWAMIIVGIAFLIHAKFTYLFPGILNGPEFNLARVLNYIYLSNQGIFGMVLGIASTMIMAFMTFGGFLGVSGVGEVFLKCSLALLGHVRGGGGKVAVLGSALLGTLTGSPMAEIGVVGTITIPLMKRIGYDRTFAGAVEAAAACGGVIDPPVMGVVAFVMADFTGIGYNTIALAAVIPAILYYLSLFFQIDLRAARTGLSGLPKSELPTLREALGGSNWILFIPMLFLILLMMVLQYDPMKAAYLSTGLLIVITVIRRRNRMNMGKVLKALESTSKSMIDVVPICALAGIIVGSISLTGLGINLSSLLITLSGGSLLALAFLTAVAIYIMGMGISAMATYILMAVMVAPALVQMGVPLLVAHFFIFYVGVSTFITPPYAPAAYLAGAIAGADPMKVGYQAMKLAIVAYLVPFVCIYQPALLWIGSPGAIVLAAGAALVAIYALSVAFEGYFVAPVSWWERPLWLIGGFLLFIPKIVFIGPGLGLVLIGFLINWPKRKKMGMAHA